MSKVERIGPTYAYGYRTHLNGYREYVALDPNRDSRCVYCHKPHTTAYPLTTITYAMRAAFAHAACDSAANAYWRLSPAERRHNTTPPDPTTARATAIAATLNEMVNN